MASDKFNSKDQDKSIEFFVYWFGMQYNINSSNDQHKSVEFFIYWFGIQYTLWPT